MNRSLRRTTTVLASLAATVSLLAAPAGASAAGLDFGLKAWWPLVEKNGQRVYDYSGQGNHGTLGSTPGADDNDPSWVTGIFGGNALRFDGNDFISIKDSASLRPAKLTVSLWVRSPQSPGAFKYLISKGSQQCTTASWGIGTGNNGGLQAYVWDGNNQIPSGGAEPAQIWDGKWHNVTLTYDGSSAQMFIDGKSLGKSPASPATIVYNLPNGDPDTTLGGYVGSCDLLFTGDLDQVMIFNQVLPVTTIWKYFGFILGKPTADN
jgi:hypothetical protein